MVSLEHYDDIKRKHFPRYWPFVRRIHQSPVYSPHKGQWRGALMFSLICAWINGWVKNPEAGDLRRHRAHYDITVMFYVNWLKVIHADALDSCTIHDQIINSYKVCVFFMWISPTCDSPIYLEWYKKQVSIPVS